MRISKSLYQAQVAVFTAIALAAPGAFTLVNAQSPEPGSTQDTQIIFNDATSPNWGAPSGRRRGGGSRGPCRQFESLTALAPATKGVVWGQTVSDHPTFWFYLPQALTEQTPIEFVIQDAADNEVYSTQLVAPQTKPGLIRLQMPPNAKSLEVGKSYTWTFSVYCDPAKPSSAVFVKGMIQRTSLNGILQDRLKTLSPLEQTRLYANNGIWFDAFNLLATLHKQQPSDRQLTSSWEALLKQAELSDLTAAPLSSCCTMRQ